MKRIHRIAMTTALLAALVGLVPRFGPVASAAVQTGCPVTPELQLHMQVCWDADPVTGYVYTCKANYNASFISYSFCEGCSADVTWDIKCVTLGIHQTTNCSWDFPCDTANNCQIRCPLTGAAWAGLVVTCGSCP